MALEFRPPSWQRPEEGPDIPRTIDAIYNAYLNAKQVQGNVDLRKIQIEQVKQDIAARNTLETMKYGMPLPQITPSDIAAAGRPPQMIPQQQPSPFPTMDGPASMGGGTAQENPALAKLRKFMESGNAADEMDKELRSLGIRKARAETEKAERPEGVREPKSVEEAIMAKYNSGEITLDEAVKKRAAMSPSYFTGQQKAEEKKIKAADAAASEKQHASDVIRAGESALGLIGKFTTSGLVGKAAELVPGSNRKALEGAINTLKANLAFERLTEMRKNSPTGGALGNVSDIEVKLLSSAVNALDPDMPHEILAQNVKYIMDKYQEILNRGEQPAAKSGETRIRLTGDKAKRLEELRKKSAGGKL